MGQSIIRLGLLFFVGLTQDNCESESTLLLIYFSTSSVEKGDGNDVKVLGDCVAIRRPAEEAVNVVPLKACASQTGSETFSELLLWLKRKFSNVVGRILLDRRSGSLVNQSVWTLIVMLAMTARWKLIARKIR